jgi:hypothetical protein
MGAAVERFSSQRANLREPNIPSKVRFARRDISDAAIIG